MGKPVNPPSGGGIETINLKDALEERYLAYALSTIMHRALPDARDGLKPVHRRILHAMRLLRLDPEHGAQEMRPHRRRRDGPVSTRTATRRSTTPSCAWRRISPSAIRWSTGQGNFGNIDGDNAAAYALHRGAADRGGAPAARRHRRGRGRFPRDLRQANEEPVVLPAAFPNLLANGSQGIAVGMATSIPPHNAAELCDAALHLISHPEGDLASSSCNFVPGPGLPDRRHHRRSAGRDRGDLPHRAAARSACGRAGRRRTPGAAPGHVVVTEIPYGGAEVAA